MNNSITNPSSRSMTRTIGIALAALALLAGAAWVAVGGIAHASSEPVISSVTASTTDTTATITWTTDEGANSQVVWGTSLPYSATSTLNTSTTTSHSETISGLSANTTYHYQVISMDSSSSTNMSADNTFMTTNTASSSASTTAPVISSIVVTPTNTGATITWMTDKPASSQVNYGPTSSYGNWTTFDGSLVMSHTATISGLSSGTTYHFQVLSNASSSNGWSTDQTFTTTNTSGGTGTTTDLITLQNQITQLQNDVRTLQAQVAALMGGSGGTGGGTVTPPPTGPATIDQNGQSVRAGTSIDFGGRNFGHEETVKVMMNGQTVATPHADNGGNFSTGSIGVPSTPGTYTYLFVGQTSGRSADATITITP